MLEAMSKPTEASIVVVDDEPSIRELLVASLHFANFEVSTAASGSEAIEVIEKVQPDLIVLDLMLPGRDGLSVCRELNRRTGDSLSPDSHFAFFAFLFHGDGHDPCLLHNVTNFIP